MFVYKFLRSGAVGPFSGLAWPRPAGPTPGAWVRVVGPVVSCRNGVHGCRVSDLPYWICDELWVLELDGAQDGEGYHLVARSGRLVEQVRTWNPTTASTFTEACTWRVRDHAASALRRAGRCGDATRLGACRTLDDLRAVTAEMMADPAGRHAGPSAPSPPAAVDTIGQLVGYVGDAITFHTAGRASVVAFVSARAAERAGRAPDTERRLQASWFDRRFGQQLGSVAARVELASAAGDSRA